MIPIPVVVCVLGGWCAVYLADTLLKVRAVGAGARREPPAPRAGRFSPPAPSSASPGRVWSPQRGEASPPPPTLRNSGGGGSGGGGSGSAGGGGQAAAGVSGLYSRTKSVKTIGNPAFSLVVKRFCGTSGCFLGFKVLVSLKRKTPKPNLN